MFLLRFFNLFDLDLPRDRVPIGKRAYEVLGLSDSDIDKLIQVTRKVLAEESVSLNLRLFRLGLGCLAYFACEKRGFNHLFRRLQLDDCHNDDSPYKKWNSYHRATLQLDTPKDAGETARSVSPVRRLSVAGFLSSNKKTPPPSHPETFSGLGCARCRDKTSIIESIFHAVTTFSFDRLTMDAVRNVAENSVTKL